MIMMKVRMLETTRGSPNGIRVNTYEAGNVYNMPRDLAKVFVKEMKVAKVVKEPAKGVKGREKKVKSVKNRETRIEKTKKENRIDP